MTAWGLWALGVPAGGGAPAHGQTPAGAGSHAPGDSVRVIGRVLDGGTGVGVPQVRISLVARSGPRADQEVWAGLTGASGEFASARFPAGVFDVRAEALGYGPVSATLELAGLPHFDLLIEISANPLELPPLLVVTQRQARLEAVGFYARRQAGMGTSFTREEIQRMGVSRPSDIFRRIPGVQLEAQRRGTASLLRYRGCYPEMLVDGVPLAGPVAVDQVLTLEEIEAVEVQAGTYGPARATSRPCGTVMVWTRQGSRGDSGPGFTWGRALTAGVLIGLALLVMR